MTMTTATDISTPLVKAITFAWAAIQRKHPDVPNVVVTIGAGSGKVANGLVLGHFAPHRWAHGENRVHELFVGGEGLEHGAAAVMATLLHEAAHGVAIVRDVQDVSRAGRYHNKVFKMLAEDMGLEVTFSKELGWSTSALPEETERRYAPALRHLDAAIVAYRRSDVTIDRSTPGTGVALPGSMPKGRGRASNGNGVALYCHCGEPRRVRVSLATAEEGMIACGICKTFFEPTP